MAFLDDDPSADPYSSAFTEHGASPHALLWNSYKSIGVRYRQLVIDLEIAGQSILDVGCGMGDLIPFLYAKAGADFRYLGVDRNKDFVAIAQKRYWGHQFEVADAFSSQFNEKADVVFSSGVLNHDEPDWLEKRKTRIAKLFELADKALAFNMAGWHGKPEVSGGIAYADIADVMDFCKSLKPRKIVLRDKYLDNDFTIVMFKQSASE